MSTTGILESATLQLSKDTNRRRSLPSGLVGGGIHMYPGPKTSERLEVVITEPSDDLAAHINALFTGLAWRNA